MSPEIAALREGFVAFITFVRSLSSVSSHVNLQGTGPHEFIATGLADVGSLP